jgi:peptide/nickel transport system ATP-binding protein
VLDLFQSLQATVKLPLLFITHDFAVVSRIAHRVAVMRFGRLLELGPTAEIVAAPAHPYTRALIAAGSGAATSLPAMSGHRIAASGTQRASQPMREVGEGHFVIAEETA